MEYNQGIIRRVLAGSVGLAGLALVFIFQQTYLSSITGPGFSNNETNFIVNRFLRIFLNDAFMLLILYALFADYKVLKLAVFIQVIDLAVLFPAYLVVKLTLEGDSEISSPFLSQFHRLIVHPTLMILLIPAFYYQKLVLRRS
jgi:exosortase F-associated protein